MPESIESRLLFVIGPPRSGTTLLMRVLSSHSQIYSRPEPHLFGPLAHLGYYDTVEKAPYDQFQAAQAIRELVAELPRGEEDYLAACRAYVDTLYGELLRSKGAGKRFFLDKTPANALVLPFITRLYPRARYLVLTRHPAAIFSSYANSFFAGDFEAAQRFNPILSRYIPAMAKLLRERQVPLIHVDYEHLVREPERVVKELCDFLALELEPDMIEYGHHPTDGGGLGDPITVDHQVRPVANLADTWVAELASNPSQLAFVRRLLEEISDADLETWGNPRSTLWRPLEQYDGKGAMREARGWSRFRFQRQLLVALRSNVQRRAWLKGAVQRSRDLMDILLRG